MQTTAPWDTVDRLLLQHQHLIGQTYVYVHPDGRLSSRKFTVHQLVCAYDSDGYHVTVDHRTDRTDATWECKPHVKVLHDQGNSTLSDLLHRLDAGMLQLVNK